MVRPGDTWCPCGQLVITEAAGWPLRPDDASAHLCPHCPEGRDTVGCGHRYCGSGHAASEAHRFVAQRLPASHDASPHRQLEHELVVRLPAGTYVEVEVWEGCDEDWDDPVYVSAWPTPRPADHSSPFHGAVCDLAAAPIGNQADFVASQLVDG